MPLKLDPLMIMKLNLDLLTLGMHLFETVNVAGNHLNEKLRIRHNRIWKSKVQIAVKMKEKLIETTGKDNTK